jgi:hypothetical protein
MGMLIKGRSLIEVARLKSELRKIERIQTSVSGWFAKTSGGMEAMDAFPLIDDSDLTKLSFTALTDISEADITNPYGKWDMYRGKLTANSDSALITAAGINVILRSELMTPRFACNIEFVLDDKDFLNGNGRSQKTAELASNGVDLLSCDNDNWSELPDNKILDYRIF